MELFEKHITKSHLKFTRSLSDFLWIYIFNKLPKHWGGGVKSTIQEIAGSRRISSGIVRATWQIQPLLFWGGCINREDNVCVEIAVIQSENKELPSLWNSYFQKVEVRDILEAFMFCLMHRIYYYMIFF